MPNTRQARWPFSLVIFLLTPDVLPFAVRTRSCACVAAQRESHSASEALKSGLAGTQQVRVLRSDPRGHHADPYRQRRRPVVVSDVIMVQRHVTLLSASGDRFDGEQYSPTLAQPVAGCL